MEPSDFEREKIERLRRAMYSRSLSGMLHERPRRALQKSERLVGDDWLEREEGARRAVVAPRFLGITRKFLWWFLGLSVAFFITAVGFFAYYFTLGGGSFAASPRNVDIVISGPSQISGGEVTKLQIVVTNRNKTSLELADLVITYPPGTRSPTDFSTDFPTQRISLGSIEPGGSRQGTVSAVFSGREGEHASVVVELEYRLQNSGGIFVASSNYEATFSSSPLSISVSGNTETISGQPVVLTVKLSSSAGAPVRDVLLRVDFPFGFVFSGSDPAPIQSGVWALGELSPGESKTVTIRGTLSGETGDTRVFRLSAGTRASPETKNVDHTYAETTYATRISQPFLGLAIGVNKTSGGNIIVGPGDNVTVAVSYQNNLPTSITDAIIVARLSGVRIDGTTVKTADGFFRSTDDTVLWDKTTTGGALSEIKPGERGTVSFSFQMPSSEVLQKVTNPRLDISVNAAGKRLSETGVPQNLQSASQQTIKLASDLQLNSQALYYASPFGSTGPMPPKAGTETTYALVFTITNTTNRIVGAKLTATLPNYVRWVGSHAPASEKLQFNQADGTFLWDIGDIAPGVGIGGSQPKQLAIAIGFSPSTSQIGDQPVLVQDVVLTGIDAATGVSVRKVALPNITTNLATVGKSSSEAIVGTDPGFSPANATVVR